MKTRDIVFIAVFTCALAGLSCDTIDEERGAPNPCEMSSRNVHIGNVMIGEHQDTTLVVRAANNTDSHIEGTAKINCPQFTLRDPDTGAPLDSISFSLDFPQSLSCRIRFEPTEVGDICCGADFGDDCGAVTLCGRGVESTARDWELAAHVTEVDLHDVFMDQNGYGVVVGDSGTVLRKGIEDADFSLWLTHGCDDTKLKAVWRDSAGKIYTAGGETGGNDGKIFRFTGSWEVIESDILMDYYCSIWGAADCILYFGGAGMSTTDGNIKFYDCVDFATLAPSMMGMFEVAGISGSSSSDVWAVMKESGNYHLYHYNGTTWSREGETWMTAVLQDVFVSGDGQVFIVGSGGTIYHHDGDSWHDSSIQGFNGNFYGVWGTAANDVFAVGADASIYHFDGNTWAAQTVPAGLTQDLFSVWGKGSFDVWTVGEGGLVLRYH